MGRKKKNTINNFKLEKNTIDAKLGRQKTQEKKELVETLITHTNTLPLQNYTIDKSGVIISPERGGTLSSLILDGVEIFYNNPKRRNDPKQSLREGYRMGPQAGPFSPEQNAEHGFDLKQHGFLRDVAREKNNITGKKVGYKFTSDKNTLKRFPYPFIAEETVELGEKGARISLNVQNTGKNIMKFAPGHHTYYKVSPDQKANITVSDNIGVSEEMKSKWTTGTETIKILNPGSCQVYIPGTGVLQLNFDPKFKYLRLRSELGEGFVCIEPVVCHPSKWDTEAININPQKTMKIGFSITLLSKNK